MANRGEDWSQEEVAAAVDDYLSMLAAELRGEPYNKAEHNRALQVRIGRTKGAIEFKHQNITAVLNEVGQPTIAGYKPAANYQASLLPDVVETALLEDRHGVRAAADRLLAQPVPSPNAPTTADVEVPAPDLEPAPHTVRQPRTPRGVFRNYVEVDSRNRDLGRAGEEFVVDFESRRLWTAGRKELAKQVEHVAGTQGDGLGYDVSSFEADGRRRLIEVKTTSFGIRTPFLVTSGEVAASARLEPDYRLYRIFNFRSHPQFFSLVGALHRSCRLNPAVYWGRR